MKRLLVLAVFALNACYGAPDVALSGPATNAQDALQGNTTQSTPTQPVTTGYVQAQGTELVANGNALQMRGFQMPVPNAPSCGTTSTAFAQALDELQAHNVNTVRMWFYQSVAGPTNWSAFDAAVAAVKQHNMRIVVTLTNQWGNCEPSVNGQPNYKTLAWYQGGYKLANDGYPLAYRDYVVALTQHFANEPTIALWQLMNEAEARNPVDGSCPNEAASAAAIRAFADDMVTAIHTVDSHHLINLGTVADDRCGTTGSDWQMVQAGGVNVCEVHTYDSATEALPPSITERVSQCSAMNKPLFAGEVGICNNVQSNGLCAGAIAPTTLQERSAFMSAKLQASVAAGLSGFLVWDYNPAGAVAGDIYGVATGDPVESLIAAP